MIEFISVGRKRIQDTPLDYYMDTRLVLGSAAESERLWYTSKMFLRSNRLIMTALILETVLFLFWNSIWKMKTSGTSYKL